MSREPRQARQSTVASTSDCFLPRNLDAERFLLGAVLIDAPGTDDAFHRLKATAFSLPEHATIYRRLKQQVEGGGRPDIVRLVDTLEAHQELEKAGGFAYVAGLTDLVPRVCQILSWIEIIEKKALLRERAFTAEAIRELACNANGDADKVLEEIASLSASLRYEIGQKRVFNFLSGADLEVATPENVPWIWKGYVAEGAITELGAKVKSGKTTMVMALARAVLEGLNFLGEPVAKTPVLYLTEQPSVSFRQAMQRAHLLGRRDFIVLTHGAVVGTPWPEVAGAAVAKCKSIGVRLLIVDTLPQFAGLAGDAENNSGDALAAMQPLQQAAGEGIAVILVRHERKSGGDVGDSGRGSSAFAGAVDIVLSLRRPKGNFRKTVRLIQALSRFSETPAELLVELTDCGYISLGEPHEAAVKEAKESILAIVPKAEHEAADMKDLVTSTEVPRATVQRAVEELLVENKLVKIGEGKKGHPFRYFTPEKLSAQTPSIDGQK